MATFAAQISFSLLDYLHASGFNCGADLSTEFAEEFGELGATILTEELNKEPLKGSFEAEYWENEPGDPDGLHRIQIHWVVDGEQLWLEINDGKVTIMDKRVGKDEEHILSAITRAEIRLNAEIEAVHKQQFEPLKFTVGKLAMEHDANFSQVQGVLLDFINDQGLGREVIGYLRDRLKARQGS